jgi:hypothetical protein
MRRALRALAVATPVAAVVAILVAAGTASSQPPETVEPRLETLFLAQATDHPSTLAFLSTAEQLQLGDPFFNVVLRANAGARDLDAIEALLQPDAGRRHTFVVDERILDPRLGQSRRAVLAYSGVHPTTGEILDGNVMLSVSFDSEDFPARPPFIEAWGWDNFRGRYNYYRLDGDGLPEGLQLWKFRGSSVGADLLSPGDREGTCMECHVNGAPVMKELPFPWNNWHSDTFPVAYLTPGGAGAWPVASHPRLAGRLRGAERLETQFLAPAIDQFNNRRINAALERRDADGDVALDADGFSTVVEARRLLKHLFTTTEINLGSARQASSLFPFPEPGPGPAQTVVIPTTFFLNSHLIGGNGPVRLGGLGLAEAREFDQPASPGGARPFALPPPEYAELVAAAGQRLGDRPGDTGFAWFGPEPSHLDNSMVDRMLRRGLLTREFVAAVVAIDLETPVFSAERARLLAAVPESYRFQPVAPGAARLCPGPDGGEPSAAACHPDDLTLKTIASLRALEPEAGSPEAELLRRLESPDPVELLRQDVLAYRERLAAGLTGPETRPAALRSLFDLAHQRRLMLLQDELFRLLDETGGLLLFPAR